MTDSDGFDVSCAWFIYDAHFELDGFMNRQTDNFSVTYICVKYGHSILQLLFRLQYPAKASLAFFFLQETITSE